MTKAVAVVIGGQTIYMELGESVSTPVVPAQVDEGLAGADKVVNKLDELGSTIMAVCRSVYDKGYQTLKESRPREFEIELGVTLAGEAGVPLVTKGSVEGALKVTARWGDAA